MVQRLVAEEAHVELVGHQALADVTRQRCMAADCGQIARVATFVGHAVLVVDPQGKGAVVVEEE